MRICLGIGLLILLVLAAGCQKAAEKASERMAEKAIEAASDGKADVDIGKGSVTVTNPETGEVTAFQAGGGMPASWPASLPPYPGATVVTQTSQEAAEGPTFYVTLQAKATPQEVADFYREKASAAGFEMRSDTKTKDGISLMYEAAQQVFVVTATASDQGCDVSLSLMPK